MCIRDSGESVGGDIPLIAVAVAVISTFCVLALFVRDRVANRTSLALLGILTVCLSISAGFGLSLYLSIPFTTLSQVSCFERFRLNRVEEPPRTTCSIA